MSSSRYLESHTGSDVVNWISSKNESLNKTKTKIKHPIFDKCSLISTDEMWKNIFQLASKGKFPSGISYRDGKLIFKQKTKIFNIVVPEDELEAFNLCKGFIAANTGLRSSDEQQFERDMMERTRTDVSLTKWSSVNKKVAESLIYSYAEFVYRRMNLNLSETYKLVSVIKLGLTLQQIQNTNIQIYNNQISHINNICYDSVNNKWFVNNVPHKKYERKTTIINSNNRQDYGDTFEVLWEKYLKKREKSFNKAQSSRQDLYSTYSDLSQLFSESSSVSKKSTRGRPRGKKRVDNEPSEYSVMSSYRSNPEPPTRIILDFS